MQQSQNIGDRMFRLSPEANLAMRAASKELASAVNDGRTGADDIAELSLLIAERFQGMLPQSKLT